ncbi:hypothetical protein [uncultured Nitratireductor sp.]|uniref:DUF6923 family protein n=1 Tax=uncultured Nitratireductor sp. TaxID=520953 RepID=UPI0025F8274A|nr:hypothetical protein [uncultured Nitratireductor sp.]
MRKSISPTPALCSSYFRHSLIFRRLYNCFATVFLVIAVWLATGLANEARAQVPPPFAGCTSDMYMAQGNPTTLLQFDTSTNPFVFNPLGTASRRYNAAAFNPADSYIYAIDRNAAGTRNILLRVGSNGQVQNLGIISGGGVNAVVGYHNGEIGSDGFLYIKQETDRMFRVDINTLTATAISLSQAVNSSDLAWHNGRLYAQHRDNGRLASINPNNGNVTFIGPTRPSRVFGAMFGASNGIYGGDNNGGFYKIDLATGATTLISNSPGSGNNDGAKCYSTPLTFAADLAVSKTDSSPTYTPGEDTVYTIVVSNSGPFGVQGAAINDPLPAGITTANWSCAAAGGAECGQANGSGGIGTTANLPVGATVTYTMTVSVPSNFTGDLTNTVTVTNPSDSPDPDTSNNTATDTDVSVPMLTLEKLVVNDAGGTATLTDFTLTANGPTNISGVSGSATVTDAPVAVGTYTLSETNRPGYTPSDYSCVINGGAPVLGNAVTLANGERAVCTITNEDDAATLTLRKTVVNNDGGTSVVGDFTLTASGPANISGVTGDASITAVPIPAGAYTLGEVAVAGYSAGIYRCSINGAPIVVSNNVTLANGDSAVCTITNDDTPPAVTIAKALVGESGSLPNTPEPGETLTYEIALTNTGGQASNYDLIDVLDGNVTFVSADNGGVLSGNEVQWTGLTVPAQDGGTPGELVLTVTVTVNALAPGEQVANLAKQPGDPDPACPSAQCVVIPPPPFIEVEKTLIGESGGTLAGTAEPGEQLTYQILLTNQGSATATYALRDRLDDNTSFVSATNGGAHSGGSPDGGQVDWTNLAVPGASGGTPGTLALQVVVSVVDPLPAGVTSLTNIAFDPGEPEPACPSPQCATVPTEGNVSIVKSLTGESGVEPDVAEPGEQLTYEITLTNTGGIANNYSVDDVLSANTTFVSATPTGNLSGGTYTWSGLTVPAHDGTTPGELVLSITVAVTDPLPDGTVEFTNIAKETGTPDPVCPSDQCVTIPASPSVSMAKSLTGESGSQPGIVEAGEQLTYTITLTNQGGEATGFAVEDYFDPNTFFVNATNSGQLAGDHIAWSGLTVPAHDGGNPGQLLLTVIVDVADPLPNGVTSVSNIVKRPGAPDPVCPSDQCVETQTEAKISLTKELFAENGASAGIAEPGEELTYRITVSNDGGAPISGYAVQDALDPNTSLMSANPLGSLSGGVYTWSGLTVPAHDGTNPGSVVLEIVVAVDDPLADGVTQLSNIAKQPGDPDPVCPSDQCVIIPSEGAVSITKSLVGESGSQAGIAEAGETLTYELTLTNPGGAVTNYAVQDVLDPNTVFVSASNGGVDNGTTVDWAGLTVPGYAGGAPGSRVLTVAVRVSDPLPTGVVELSNIAKKPGDPDPACPSPQCVVTPSEGSVTIAKALVGESGTQDGVAEAGETLNYTITLTNNGGEATGYAVQDVLDPNTVFVSASNGGVDNGTTIDWSGLTVPAYAGGTPGVLVLTVDVQVADPLPAGVSQVLNIAKRPGDPDPACPSDQCVVTPSDNMVTIAKALVGEDGAAAGTAEPGETLTYEISLSNDGGIANNYSVQDVLDPNTVFVSATNGGVDNGATIDWGGLTVPAHDGTNPGTLVLTAEVRVVDPLPTGVTELRNIAKQPGEPDPTCPSDQCAITPAQDAKLVLAKSGAYEDSNGDGVSSIGDLIRYTFTVRNDGNVELQDVTPVDDGPTFDGTAGAGRLSEYAPKQATLAPGGEQVFTATYALTQADIDLSAGLTDSVENTATARGYANGNVVNGRPVESNESASLLALPAAASNISVEKIALLHSIRRGEQAPFVIRLTNHSGSSVTGLVVTDTLPSGFRYVAGSARIDGVEATPVVGGRTVTFENISLTGNQTMEIRLSMLALSSAGPGKHTNTASVTDSTGTPLAPSAKAVIEILVEPVFDCGDVIGKVFDDVNRNGYQDKGEPGLPGVRIATVKGWLVTTDRYGRFHVACAMLPDQRIGSNFIMKLDTRTLPTGYRVTTENPRVVRLTAGKMTKLNFGASIGRVVRLDLKSEAFAPGGNELDQRWGEGIDQLMTVLRKEESVLRLSYIDAATEIELAKERLKALRALIEKRWREEGANYPLEIETRVEVGQ